MLAISTRVRYGLRALAFLAEQEEDRAVSLNLISEKESISRKYLENIFRLLKKGKIVRSVRGADGGYQLERAPESISIYEIVKALEGPISPSRCLTDPFKCKNVDDCGTRDFWKEFQNYLEDFFRSKTLAQLIGQIQKGDTDGKKICLYG